MTFREVLRRSDPLLSAGILLLGALSLVLLATGTEEHLANSFFLRQAVWFGVGLATYAFLSRTHYALLRTLAPVAYALLLILLVVVTQQQAIRGAASWLAFGTVHLQPSELAKVILVIVLAKLLGERRTERLDLRTLLLSLVYAGVPIALVFFQPDFGTASLLAFLTLGMVISAGMSRRHIIVLLVVGLLAGGVGWSFLLRDYQQDRLRVFLQPKSDPLGAGYTVLQSVTSLGSGGLLGRGLGHGPQSRLNFLPEHRTDFIFSRIGEELGFVGVGGVLLVYGVLLFRILRAAERTSDAQGRMVVVGAFLVLLVGVGVNAGMNIGLLPVTGVPLPLVSYGGSSLLAMCALLGLVQSVLVHGEAWESVETSAHDMMLPKSRSRRPRTAGIGALLDNDA